MTLGNTRSAYASRNCSKARRYGIPVRKIVEFAIQIADGLAAAHENARRRPGRTRKVYEENHTLLEENFRAYINGFSVARRSTPSAESFSTGAESAASIGTSDLVRHAAVVAPTSSNRRDTVAAKLPPWRNP